MRLTLLAVASLTAAACATGGTVPDERLTDTFTGTVNGVIVLAQPAGSGSCSELAVYATATGEQGATPARVGRAAVHQGSGRCSYEITNLPPNVNIDLHVDPAAGMACSDGSLLTFAPSTGSSFTINDHTSITRDFRGQCSAGHSSR
jgi:hypothetical protein